MRNITWGSLLFAVGVTVVLLLKLDIIRPAEWFMDPEPVPSDLTPLPNIATADGAQANDIPAFTTIAAIDRRVMDNTRAGKVITESELISKLVQGLNNNIRLPQTIGILLKPCGDANAYYDPNVSRIVFCDEFLHQFEQLFSTRAHNQADFESAVLGTTAFFIFHALIDQLELNFLGREEDAADEIATYLLTVSGASAQAFRGAQFFAILSEYMPGASFPYWDEHSLNEQRFYNISCLLYGYEPGRFASLKTNSLLPADADQRCPANAARNARTIAALLGPHLR